MDLSDLIARHPRYPWDRVEIIDRGFDQPCVIRVDVQWLNSGNRATARLWRVEIGEPQQGSCYMHTCEIYGETNRCMLPAHIQIGTFAENNAHAARLARLARGPRVVDAATREKISRSMRAYLADEAARERWRLVQVERDEEAKEQTRRLVSTALLGRDVSADTRERMSDAARRRWQDPEQVKAMRKKRQCPDCGRKLNAHWMTRHKREGRCVVA
ncbi:MAG TPA: hypothetical protein VLE97_07900 [Gaiellaceae bacterium]|nr:hypothetical protein [Gaiellaceae bacterium]